MEHALGKPTCRTGHHVQLLPQQVTGTDSVGGRLPTWTGTSINATEVAAPTSLLAPVPPIAPLMSPEDATRFAYPSVDATLFVARRAIGLQVEGRPATLMPKRGAAHRGSLLVEVAFVLVARLRRHLVSFTEHGVSSLAETRFRTTTSERAIPCRTAPWVYGLKIAIGRPTLWHRGQGLPGHLHC